MATVITYFPLWAQVLCHFSLFSFQFHLGITFIDILEKLEYGFLQTLSYQDTRWSPKIAIYSYCSDSKSDIMKFKVCDLDLEMT